eukprot:TRINITY_DN13501_c0_g1_i1.p1 TRINITY_DN13501_c0_g1~~TRINITY_DN13501_c0_g1_i1.p1  ORF type:complete len:337 (-),score=70.16 TRINITY_DN13501_c0_g1_i1:62-1024(-)
MDVSGDGGVLKTILREGTSIEKPRPGDEVTVHYTGSLEDGTVFDSSRSRPPLCFKVGSGGVLKGWDRAVQSMHLGEVCRVALLPEYGYGAAGAPPKVPPGSKVVFEMELLSWTSEKDVTEAKDMGVMKRLLEEGTHWDNPNYEACCKVMLEIMNENGDLYFNGFKEITLGDDEIPFALETVLTGMKKGEYCHVRVKSKYGYGERGNQELGIPPNTDLIYHIRLLDFEKGKESWLMGTFEDKVEVVNKRKKEGNRFFEEGKYGLGIRKYEKAIEMIKYDSTFTEQQKNISNSLKVSLYLNLSATYMKREEYKRVLENTTKV